MDGYAAPQLHTHAVVFNMTERENGETRALQERSLFQSQRYVTSIYRSELAVRLGRLGYEIEIGKHGQPEIKGYSKEYLEASSPRREQILAHLAEVGRDGAGAAQVAAHRTRDKKEIQSQEEVLRRHRQLAAQFGGQADHVVAQARELVQEYRQLQPERAAQQAATYARNHVFERSAVQDERAILQSMLDRGMGRITYGEARSELAHRVATGEFRSIGAKKGHAAPQYTTAEMVRMEREIIERMRAGNHRTYSDPMLVSPQLRIKIEDGHPELNSSQYHAVDEIFLSREKIVGLEGVAGAGKTTALAVIREGAVADGYCVEGFAPTSRAAQKLAEAGIETSTLQKHLAHGGQPDTGAKRLYVLDESSLASTRQMHDFVQRLHRNDRVLLVGDTRQHESTEAGRPFAQLQEAGMLTVKLDQILRQRDPELKEAVEQLSRGEVRAAIQNLDLQRRVHEISNREDRIGAIARGTVERVAEIGLIRVRMDSGREITFDSHRHPHFDHGYAVTSHSSQGLTAERVLIHVDTELGAKDLLNHRMAYVSVSRGQYDAQIFTNDLGKLSQALSHDVSHQSAYKPERAVAPTQQKIAPSPTHEVEQGFGFGLGLCPMQNCW